MTAHLNLPYVWENCAELEFCDQSFHFPDSAETLNSYPKEWVKILLPKSMTVYGSITLYNIKNQVHNSNGPAIEDSNGTLQWFFNGKRHREDGPAYVTFNGREEWWVNGDHHREDGPAATENDGSEEWLVNNVLHREDGPATTDSLGTQRWYFHGELHRVDGPAVTYSDGPEEHNFEEWWTHGIHQPTPLEQKNL